MKSIKKPYLLAIDGPAGSGKGTVAKLLSKKLNLNYLDSGAIYRLIALSAMEEKVDLENDKNLVDLIRIVDINFVDEQILLNNINVSKKIRYERYNPTCGKPKIKIKNTGSTDLTSLKIEYWINNSTN